MGEPFIEREIGLLADGSACRTEIAIGEKVWWIDIDASVMAMEGADRLLQAEREYAIAHLLGLHK